MNTKQKYQKILIKRHKNRNGEEKEITSSLMDRVGNPFEHDREIRLEYYTRIEFEVADIPVNIPIKVDTGAVFTIIGIDNENLIACRDIIEEQPVIKDRGAESASGNPIELRSYNVKNFKITDGIIFPNIEVYFSKDIGERVILGMDILGLFNFNYSIDNSTSLGEIWLSNFDRTKELITTHDLSGDNECVHPYQICEISDVSPEQKFTTQDLMANKVNKMIEEEKNKQ